MVPLQYNIRRAIGYPRFNDPHLFRKQRPQTLTSLFHYMPHLLNKVSFKGRDF